MASDLDLDAIKRRCEAATVPPWALELHDTDDPGVVLPGRVSSVPGSTGNAVVVFEEDGRIVPCDLSEAEDVANLQFIAHAREDVPALLAEVDRLRDALFAITGLADSVAVALEGAVAGHDRYPDATCEVARSCYFDLAAGVKRARAGGERRSLRRLLRLRPAHGAL